VPEPDPPLPLPPEAFNTPELKRELAKAILKDVYKRYPRFWDALKEDTRVFLTVRGETRDLGSAKIIVREAMRLCWETDAFLGLALYRARGRLLARGVPVLPQLIHKTCMALWQIDIGDPVVIEPGVYIPHGQVVIDGNVEIGKGAVLTPWISIGLVEGNVSGPKIGQHAFIGTGARVLGDIKIGSRAKIGANAVVNRDVPPGTTVAGVPARVVGVPARPRRKGGPPDKVRQAVAEKRAAAARAAVVALDPVPHDDPE
jgi:serine O-acetyltransferase